MERCRVLVVDDHPLFRQGVRYTLETTGEFEIIAEAADVCGLDVLGFTSQAAFLLGTGIESMLAAEKDAVLHARRVSEARQLLLPDAMGEAFKVLALGRGWDPPLAGFAHQDLLNRL